ncbi:MAG: hypothetical protein U1E83_01205 [Methylotetracoccus sp.]
MRFEIEARELQVRLYADDPDNYVGVFTAFPMGGTLYISGLLSLRDGFHRDFAHLLPEILRVAGARVAELLCSASHARLLTARYGRWLEVRDLGEEQAYGRSMRRMQLAPREAG